MKKNILLTIFVVVFSSVASIAQSVYIPQLDPVRMHIQQQIFQQMMSAEARKGGAKGAKTTPQAAAVDYTLFNPRQENFLPKLLAGATKANAAERQQAEQFFNSQIEMYEQTAGYHRYPANDVAFALEYFISNNYEVYYDLITVPKEKDPWAKRAKNLFDEIALMNEKKSRKITSIEDRAMYFQIKDMLSANPEFRKMNDEQKQKMTETLAIMYGVLQAKYLKAIDEEDGKSISEAHETAKQNLEGLLGVPVAKIRILIDGLHLQ